MKSENGMLKVVGAAIAILQLLTLGQGYLNRGLYREYVTRAEFDKHSQDQVVLCEKFDRRFNQIEVILSSFTSKLDLHMNQPAKN